MANRSLFSPFSSSVSRVGGYGLGSLFRPRLRANPDYLRLLEPGVEPSNEMLMSGRPFIGTGGLFGSAKRLEDLANLQYLAPLIQANFSSNLALQKEKELIPFRSATELQQRKDEYTFKTQEENKQKEIEQSQLGSDIGNVLANFPAEQMSNVFPQGQTFRNPVDQARAYIAKFGNKTPLNEAVVQGDPRVIQANVGEAMGKEYLPLGSGDRFNPRTQQVVEGPSTIEEMIKEMVATGKTEPYIGPDGEVKYRPEYKEQIRTIRKPSPATQYKLPETITQEELDSISKDSGASNQSGQNPDVSSLKNITPPEALNQLMSTDFGPKKKPVIQAAPAEYEGLLPTIASHFNEAMKSIDPGLHFKKAYEEGAAKLFPSKGLAPVGKEIKEGVKGIGETANMLRQSLIKKKGEKPAKLTSQSDPLSMLLNPITRIASETGQTVREVIEGLRDLIPYYQEDNKPLPMKKKEYFPKGFKRNFELGDTSEPTIKAEPAEPQINRYSRFPKQKPFDYGLESKKLKLEETTKGLESKSKNNKTSDDFRAMDFSKKRSDYQHIIEENKLDKKQQRIFEDLINNYKEKQGKKPSYEILLQYLNIAVGKELENATR